MDLRPFGFALAFSVTASAVQGQIPEGMDEGAFEPHPQAEEAISRLYSPFCPGFMLEVCTASQSASLRDSIHALAYQGWSSGELVEWMIGNHGEEYRAVPETSGWGVLAWILPPLAILAGAALVTVAVRRFRPAADVRGEREAEADPAYAGAGISPEEQERLRSAIREIELSEDPSF
ncbi:MAG: cytochrome c-type biogenesis protein CcmH [Gammaproteobacteria bacterium]|nr:cytochrome c-type biogenesis protein CcmH [Gammaproteobacteria bacterium]MDE0247319.1 cytochrome c-type biogenesis protein CcmH [Gammaproteobacteria bacterium]